MSGNNSASAATFYGITFPSGAEAKRYLVLRDLLEKGIITDLKVAARGDIAPFVLVPAFEDADNRHHQDVAYTPDFMYRYADGHAVLADYDGRVWHIEEIKGRIYKDYPLRKKLFLWFYGKHYVFHEYNSRGREINPPRATKRRSARRRRRAAA